MIFIKARVRPPHLFFVLLLTIISITRAHGQESVIASFSLDNNILDVPVLEVQGVGYYKIPVSYTHLTLTTSDLV